MLIIAYPVDDAFLRDPVVQLARQDAEISVLHDVLEKVLSGPEIQLALRHDLIGSESRALWKGCPSLPVAVTVCLAVVRRLMGWSYRVTAQEVNGSARWRWVCQLYGQPMPNFRTIQEREAQIKPRTLHMILVKVVELGRVVGLTTGQRLRVDSTVIESNIHYPTDSSLLNDAARVLSRLIHEARRVVPPTRPDEKAWYRDRHRQARRLARQIGQAFRRSRKKAEDSSEKSSRQAYAQLIILVNTLVEQVAWIQPRLARRTDLAALGVQQMFQQYVPLVQQVITQARQRILAHVTVPASEKIVSLFDAMSQPHRGWVARWAPAHGYHSPWQSQTSGHRVRSQTVVRRGRRRFDQ